CDVDSSRRSHAIDAGAGEKKGGVGLCHEGGWRRRRTISWTSGPVRDDTVERSVGCMGKRWLSALVIVFVATMWISGVRSPVEAQSVTVRMVWQGEANEMQLYEGLISKFEQTHPNIKVKLETVVASSDPEYFQKVQVIAASGDYPDVIYGHYSWFPAALEKHFL